MCSERRQLFERYESYVTAYFEAVIESRPASFWSDELHAKSRSVESARMALEQHERDHGCGLTANHSRPH
jgi:hypothetical protein